MLNQKFTEEEMTRIGSYKLPGSYGPASLEQPKLNTPITPRENMMRVMKGEQPMWLPNMNRDMNIVCPDMMPDASARAFGGIDWFGVDWQYEPLTKAAMVRPGTRRLSDITKWREELIFPDLNDLDWEKDSKELYHMLPNDRFTYFIIYNGIFERLADLTSFEDAFCYLLEEQEELTAFFDKMIEWYIGLTKIARTYYHADMILFHDDMGTQRAPFFSPEIYEELFIPQYQKLTGAVHEQGMFIALHSCGNVRRQIPNFITAGFDAWEGQEGVMDKDEIMETFGDQLVQIGQYQISGDLTDEEAVEALRHMIETRGRKGRCAYRIRDNRPRKGNTDLEDEMYRCSRKFYDTLIG
ncbi:MAG TPA: hypothetical protein IAB54_01030 [Candidatus Scatomonas merdigallinarum]|nr:hypothetical protein [Candidatus Scatomonas merdigallinarum]